jgi:hypothetical protein
MAKYLVLWEMVPENIPKDPVEQAKLFGHLMEIVQKTTKEGRTTDWGMFPGGNAGYSIHEGTPETSFAVAMQYTPYFKFDVKPVLTSAEAGKVMQSMQP